MAEGAADRAELERPQAARLFRCGALQLCYPLHAGRIRTAVLLIAAAPSYRTCAIFARVRRQRTGRRRTARPRQPFARQTVAVHVARTPGPPGGIALSGRSWAGGEGVVVMTTPCGRPGFAFVDGSGPVLQIVTSQALDIACWCSD